jgi:phthalate 4,5-dioxygenase reductase subunit
MSGPGDTKISLAVTRAESIADGIFLFEFRAVQGELPPFDCGAHIEFVTPSGLLRKYSLCNDPAERDRYVVAVRREAESRGGSASMAGLQVGDKLLASPPRNNFPLAESPAGYTLIAGGIGITPILSMIHMLQQDETRRYRLYYLTRSPEVTAFRDELSAAELKGKVVIHHDQGQPDLAYDLWPALETPRGHIYCCGPRALMESVRDMTGHWSPSSVHFEAFGDTETKKKDDKPFQVRLARSGTTLDVASGTTILEALRANGFDAPSSCEGGSCGTCRTPLLAGEADHRDLVLSEHEKRDNIMICVSRARTDAIIIDL